MSLGLTKTYEELTRQKVTPFVEAFLCDIETLCDKQGGKIISRQVKAVAIITAKNIQSMQDEIDSIKERLFMLEP